MGEVLWMVGIILLTVLGAAAAIFVFLWIWLILSAAAVNPKKEYPNHSDYYRFLLNVTTGVGIFLLRIHAKVIGKELLPEGKFLFVCNHRSNFDPILTWYLLRKTPLAFISKPENFRIPFFGRVIRRCCFLPIDRENPRNALRTVLRAAELLREEPVSVAVYPEGTRSKSGELLPFHNGMFKIAQKAGVPVVVAVIQGTEQIHKRYPWHSTSVQLRILDVIPAEVVAQQKTDKLGEYAAELMKNQLEGSV